MEKQRMTIRIVKELNQELSRIAKETGRSRNDLIITACWELLKEMQLYKGGAENGRN